MKFNPPPGKAIASAFLTIFLLLIVLLMPEAAGENIWVSEGTVAYGEYAHTQFQAALGDKITVELEADREVDLLLVDEEGFGDYETVQIVGHGVFYWYPEGSSLNVSSRRYSFTIPETQLYYFIIDNTNEPSNGAVPLSAVNYNISIVRDVMGYDFTLLWLTCGIVGVVLLVILIVALYVSVVKPKKEADAASEYSPIYQISKAKGPMTCPACGVYSAEGLYCENCGRRLR